MSLRLLKKIASLEPAVHLMGGFAEDILLRGVISEGHRDIDLLVTADRLSTAAEQLAGYGLDWDSLDNQPGSPWLFSDGGEIPVEVWTCVPTAGSFVLVIPASDGRQFRLRLPDDTFMTPATTVLGITVHTVSPIALYLLRSASADTRHSEERRKRDLEVMKQLRTTLLRKSESDLALELKEIKVE